MTLSQINAQIAAFLSDLAANPAKMTPAALDHLATLNGRREALAFMESLPADVQGTAARDRVMGITLNSGNLRGAEVASTMGALAVYGSYVKAA